MTKATPKDTYGRLAVLAALALFAAAANAATITVFSQYIGTLSPSAAQKDAYTEFMSRSNMDFGFFCGPSTAGGFGFTHSDYTKSASDTASGSAGFHFFVYKTARWRLLKQYNMSTASNKSSSANACVVEDKTTGEQFAFIMYTTSTFGYSSGGTPAGPISTMRNSCSSDYPNARVLIGVTKQYGLFDGSQLNAYLVNQGFTQARSGTSCGAIYCQNHASRLGNPTASAVDWLNGAAEPAAMAAVVYRQQFTVSFEDWDGTSLGAAQTVYAGEDATPPANPTRTGYTFTGWSGSYQNIQANTTLTAQYAINTYTVRFLDYNGNVLKQETVDYGSDATPPADPTREGWRFTGWQGDYTGITADTDITATYVDATVATHWVTFLDWDGTQLSRQEVEEGSDAVPPANPDNKAGWHFTGWDGSYQNVQSDITLTAQYAINTYTVTFQDWDETVLKAETVNHGSDATPPDDPERTGYTFREWSGSYSNIQAVTTITALYDINHYTVTFQYTNGTVIAQQTVEYLGSATKPANPEPIEEGTVFYRWDGEYTSVTSNTDVFAVFVPNVIEIGTGAEFAQYMKTDLVTLSGVTFALTNDISLSGVSYTKPATFAATLDGRGHTLRSFPSNQNVKHICTTLTGTIRDLCIANYTSPANIGLTSLLAGSANGATVSGVVMTNCVWNVPSATQGTAGFFYTTAGYMTTITNCTMVNCRVRGNNAIKGDQVIGGFVAKASSLRMVDCHFLYNNTNTVAIGSAIPIAGALIGECGGGVTIERCSNNAHVRVEGFVEAQDGGAGGLVGKSTSNSGSPVIRNCANFGPVEASAIVPAGGIIGHVGTESGTFAITLVDTFNYGPVTSPLAAGGLIGRYRGVISPLRNNGNSGPVRCDTCWAGGLVGFISFNDNNRTWRIENALQAGQVITYNGFAGIVLGGFEDSIGSGLSLVVSNVVMAGSATVTSDGGKTGLIIAGRDTNSQYDTEFVVVGSQVLDSNAELPHYYDKNNEPVEGWETTPPTTFTASVLNDPPIRRSLNAYAASHNCVPWIRGHDYPELATFGTECIAKFIMLIR